MCEALRALHETRLYLDLGFPGLAGYADAFFQLRRAETFEYVRVARRLLELTRLREAFAEGRLGWSVLKAITRVASADSQAMWIAFACEHGVERTLAEARDALRHGREAPRDSSYGLPNLDQKLVLRFARSDMEKVRRWIEGACALVVESTGAEGVSLEQAVLFLCEQDEASGASSSSRTQIVYQRCPDCKRARVGTRDGFVEVAAEEVERYEGCAEQIPIDGPTPPRLRRQILAREGGRCGNPRCHHPADHCHHIVFRSQGGKTELTNEVAVCGTCHALVHAGLLRVSGQAHDDLCWRPVVAERAVATRLSSLNSDPLTVLQFVGAPVRKESANADSFVEDLTSGLVRLGIPTARSRELVHAAIEAMPPAEATEAGVLQRALASL